MIKIQETTDRNILLTGGEYELLIPLDYGPRVMSLRFGDGPNMFQILTGEDPNAELRIRGGHRLWVAPERKAVTWVDDNLPVEVEQEGDHRVVIRGGREARTGLIKEMAIEIDDDVISVTHQIYNANPWRIEFAPWALTIMNPGGWAIAPFPPRGKHPVDLAPSNPLVMWPYTDLSDPRWKFFEEYFTLRQDSGIVGRPQKIGSFAEETWCAYINGEYVFTKSSQGFADLDYPDMGSSFELFSNHEMLELETLGPVVALDPGEAVRHEEEWNVDCVPLAELGTADAPGTYFTATS